jgi:hypothetical protein
LFGLNYAECVQAVAEAPLKYWACLLGRLAGGVGALLRHSLRVCFVSRRSRVRSSENFCCGSRNGWLGGGGLVGDGLH